MNYLFTLIALIGIFSIVTLSTNVLIGYGGIVSMGQAATFGIAAYTSGVLTVMGVNWWLALIPVILVTCIANAIVTIPSVRAGGLYYMVVTFGFCRIMYTIFSSWNNVTGGSNGLIAIPKASFFGMRLGSSFAQMCLVLALLAICFLIAKKILTSPYGELVEAMRQNSVAIDAVGKSSLKIKITNAILSGFFCAIGGALYAQFMAFLSPENFNQSISYNLTIYVFLGGAATLMGSIAGPLFMLLIPQLIGLLPIPASMTGPLQQLIYGLLLVLFMLFRPGGLVIKKYGLEAQKDDWISRLLKSVKKGSVTNGNS